MFTKNWYKTISSVMYSGIGTFINVNNDTKNMINGLSIGIGSTGSGGIYIPYMKHLNPSITSCGTHIGTGTTPPTINDYCFSGDLITDFTYSCSLTKNSDENGSSITALYTITNTGDTAFTIGEIGLTASLGNNNYSDIQYIGLLERTVLETPVTIEPGGVGQVTYTIRMNYPTA